MRDEVMHCNRKITAIHVLEIYTTKNVGGKRIAYSMLFFFGAGCMNK